MECGIGLGAAEVRGAQAIAERVSRLVYQGPYPDARGPMKGD